MRVHLRPWLSRGLVAGEAFDVPSGSMLLLEAPIGHGDADTLTIEGRRHVAERRFALGQGRLGDPAILRPPLPLDPARGLTATAPGVAAVRIRWPGAPRRPPPTPDMNDRAQAEGMARMALLGRLAARIEGIAEAAAARPSETWERTRARWLDADDDHNPTMDVIVRQARELGGLFEALATHPRRVLRRTHRLTPLERIDELDRRALLWALRQPGETIVEKAGPSQRLLAPARVETLDTPENRLLRAHAALSGVVAREYERLNAGADAGPSARLTTVRAHGRRCVGVARALVEAGVASWTPGQGPNYVLQHDPRYARVWAAWEELRQRRRIGDDMWRWQANSWDEFCTVALAVACSAIEGAELLALAPLRPRLEMARGRRLSLRRAIATFFLPASDKIVEVMASGVGHMPSTRVLGAPVWLRVSALGGDFPRWFAVWPLAAFGTAPMAEELHGMEAALSRRPAQELISGGIALRMLDSLDAQVVDDQRTTGRLRLFSLYFGPASAQLAPALRRLGAFIAGVSAP